MQTQFDSVKNVLYIRPLATTKFSDIHVIYFSGANDVNMCANSQSSHTFDYQIVDGVIPDLKTQQVSFNLSHMGGVLGNVTLNLGFFDSGIINV